MKLLDSVAQWIERGDSDFDGIRYESCNSSDEVKSLGGHNIVLVSNKFDSEGYDIRLRNCKKVGVPSVFDINTISVSKGLKIAWWGKI